MARNEKMLITLNTKQPWRSAKKSTLIDGNVSIAPQQLLQLKHELNQRNADISLITLV